MSTTAAMLSSEARVPTNVPRRYLAQLCKHFGHKLTVNFDDTCGAIEFANGRCELAAEADTSSLIMRIMAADEPDLARLQDIIARHLERFAFREKPEVSWTRAA
jgi:uncharacterized protein